MKFNIAIAIERNDKKVNELGLEVQKLLSKFDQEREVPEYKRYLEQEEIQDIAKYYKISPEDLKSVAEKVDDYVGGQGGVDENGVYDLTTNNPEGKFDDWEVFYYATPDDFEGKILGSEWPRVRSFVSPDLEWIEGYWSDIEAAVMSGEEEKYYAWKDRLVILLETYKDCAIFIARCHF